MKISNVKGLIGDWMKATYRFGFCATKYLTDRLDMSPKSAKITGGIIDVAAGAGFTYWGVTGAIWAVSSAVAAVTAIAAAPLTAVGTVLMSTLWLALSCGMACNGFGFLGAARQKAGIPSLPSFFRRAKNGLNQAAEKISKPFKDAKIAHKFKKAANNNQPSVNNTAKPASTAKKKFTP
jgi:hypothetical protein